MEEGGDDELTWRGNVTHNSESDDDAEGVSQCSFLKGDQDKMSSGEHTPSSPLLCDGGSVEQRVSEESPQGQEIWKRAGMSGNDQKSEPRRKFNYAAGPETKTESSLIAYGKQLLEEVLQLNLPISEDFLRLETTALTDLDKL